MNYNKHQLATRAHLRAATGSKRIMLGKPGPKHTPTMQTHTVAELGSMYNNEIDAFFYWQDKATGATEMGYTALATTYAAAATAASIKARTIDAQRNGLLLKGVL